MSETSGYILVFFVTAIIVAVIFFLIIYAVYVVMKRRIFNNFNIALQEYCDSLPSPVTYVNQSIPVPTEGEYSQATAEALLEVSFNTSDYNCGDRGVVLPPGFTSYRQLLDQFNNVLYGVVYLSSSKVVIVFCGTLLLEQWSVDLDYPQVTPSLLNGTSSQDQVHRGFYNAYVNYCQSVILDALSGYSSPVDVMVTGHSLGGALSTLCAQDVFTRSFNFASKTHYSFASPRVGNNSFASTYDSSVEGIRVNNTEDIIPQFPLVKMGANTYEHVGKNVPFTYSYGNIKENHVQAYKNFMPACPLAVGACSS